MFRTGVQFSSCDANIPLTFWRLSSVRLATVAVIVGRLTVTTLLLIGVCVLCCVGLVFSHNQPRDRLGETSRKWPILCRVGHKTTTQSISQQFVAVSTCTNLVFLFLDHRNSSSSAEEHDQPENSLVVNRVTSACRLTAVVCSCREAR